MEYNQQLLNDIKKELNVEEVTAKCLISAGLSSIDECRDFLRPDIKKITKIEDYDGLKDVADRIKKAIENNESIMIMGDYDTDGICSTAMLKMFLDKKGANVNYFIPDRHTDGYGLSEGAIEAIAEEYNPDLYITVDCGITNINEVDYIFEAIGSDVVITDHHEPQDVLPNCKLFNPHVNTHKGAYEYLCGAGVVLRLIEALSSFDEALEYCDLAALATVADVMPLNGDNRAIVAYGLSVLNNKPRKGLDMLIKSCMNKEDNITSMDIGFKIAPRLNSVGRLDNANQVVDLFIEDDYFLLQNLVEKINEFNNERQALTTKLYEEAVEMLETYDFEKYPIIILAKKGWNDGILGNTASRIVSEFNRPTILLTEQPNGDLKGSGRSIEAVNIFECVRHSSLNPSRFGGHSQAFGVSMSKDELEEFRESINKYFKQTYDNEVLLKDSNEYFDFHDIVNIHRVAKELELLEPFGQGNKRPLFQAVIGNIGFDQMNDKPHIKLSKSNFQIVGFNMIDKLDIINSEIEKIITFTMSINYFKGVDRGVQAYLDKIKCISHNDNLITNYVATALFPDSSIFHPKKMKVDEAKTLIDGNDYSTAYIAFTKQSFDEFDKACQKKIVKNSYFIENPSPNNAIYFNIDEMADLSRYKNVVFLDRPLSLGYIDILKLNKDCNVYYVENDNGINLLKSYNLTYEKLGLIYREIEKTLQNKQAYSILGLYAHIENLLNINYNIFIIAMFIFMDLKILIKEGKFVRLQKNVKNPISNSRLYNLIVEG